MYINFRCYLCNRYDFRLNTKTEKGVNNLTLHIVHISRKWRFNLEAESHYEMRTNAAELPVPAYLRERL